MLPGISPHGQGEETTFAQIAGDEAGDERGCALEGARLGGLEIPVEDRHRRPPPHPLEHDLLELAAP